MNEENQEITADKIEASQKTSVLPPRDVNVGQVAILPTPCGTHSEDDRGDKIKAPSVDSDEYVRYVEDRYDRTVLRAVRRFASKEISNDELARIIFEAALEYNAGMREHVTAVETMEQEEDALAEFDEDLKEQLRVQRALNARIKERTRQLKEEQRNARLRQQLEKEKQRTQELQGELNKVDNSGTSMSL